MPHHHVFSATIKGDARPTEEQAKLRFDRFCERRACMVAIFYTMHRRRPPVVPWPSAPPSVVKAPQRPSEAPRVAAIADPGPTAPPTQVPPQRPGRGDSQEETWSLLGARNCSLILSPAPSVWL
jgi:hypothetical protein